MQDNNNNVVLETINQCHFVLNESENSSSEKNKKNVTNKFYEHLYNFVLQLKTKGITEDTL